jgi:galactitol-specific phosphotransferase system IIB component
MGKVLKGYYIAFVNLKIMKKITLLSITMLLSLFGMSCGKEETPQNTNTNTDNVVIDPSHPYYFEITLNSKKTVWSGFKSSNQEGPKCVFAIQGEYLTLAMTKGVANMYPNIIATIPFTGVGSYKINAEEYLKTMGSLTVQQSAIETYFGMIGNADITVVISEVNESPEGFVKGLILGNLYKGEGEAPVPLTVNFKAHKE